MTRQQVAQLRSLTRELELIREEKKTLESRVDSMGRWPDGMPRSGQVGDPVGSLAIELAKTDEMLIKLEARVQAERNKIIRFISNLSDSRTRQIVYLRCVSCLQWDQIVAKTGDGSLKTAAAIYYRVLEGSEKNEADKV